LTDRLEKNLLGGTVRRCFLVVATLQLRLKFVLIDQSTTQTEIIFQRVDILKAFLLRAELPDNRCQLLYHFDLVEEKHNPVQTSAAADSTRGCAAAV